MRRDIVTALVALVVFTVLLGLVYPFAITGMSQVAFPGNADGQKVYVNGRLVGLRIIGQQFTTHEKPDVHYFQSRPSATTPPGNAAASTFSNLGPNSKATSQAIAEHLKAYLQLEKPYDPTLTPAAVPVDAANSSASGIDPEISPANARIQAHRIASVRHLPLSTVDRLVSTYTSARGLGFSGEPGVNVLELNLALDRLSTGAAG